MRLGLISELRFGKAAHNMRALLATMPKHKRQHSVRVGRALHRAGANKTGIYAGLLHDFLERGGDPEVLARHIDRLGLPPRIIQVVHALSQDEVTDGGNNQPLEHMQRIIPAIQDRALRNIVLLIKLSDRIDNIRRRIEDNTISQKYLAKSHQLIQYLQSQYSGEPRPFRKLLADYRGLLR